MMESVFAIELYLKSLSGQNILHQIEGIENAYQITAKATASKEHKLTILFDTIELQIRNEIEDCFKPCKSSLNRTFREELANYDYHFVKTRYSFEYKDLPSSSITRLIELLLFIEKYTKEKLDVQGYNI